MEKIVKAYWNCKYCQTKDIDGLIDTCPNCGKQKSSDVTYHIKKGNVEYVTEEELSAHHISKEECDGNHKDWICNYCDQLNNWSDDICRACGAPKSEATHEYGHEKIKKPETDTDINVATGTDKKTVTENTEETNVKHKKQPPIAIAGIILSVLLILGLAIYAFFPLTKTITVSGFSWNRTITVEEERTVKEDGWSVPSRGRVYDEKTEFRNYVQVIDHYETVTETKSRQIVDHYETTYSYRDNGNGTMTEVPQQKPVYRTEYYTESHQEPVYRQQAVYDTKYYYEIERWFDMENYESSGTDHSPYWNTDYTLESNERDTKRNEQYFVHYDDNSSNKVKYTDWTDMEIGDGYKVVYNRLGLTYSRTEISKEN